MIVNAVKRVQYAAGSEIVARGSPTSHFFILESGQCAVETGDGDVLVLANGEMKTAPKPVQFRVCLLRAEITLCDCARRLIVRRKLATARDLVC